MIKKYQEFTHAPDSINLRLLSETVNEIVDKVNSLDEAVGLIRALMGKELYKPIPESPEDNYPNTELIIKYLRSKSIFNIKFEHIDFTDIHQVTINGIEFKRSGS